MPLHVRDLGSGPPVVFLHPGPGLDGSVFLPGAQRVADAGYRVLLVDLPGSGRSPAADWTLAGYAEAVEDFVNELGLQDWTLLGHSFGGYVAMQHVVDYGDRRPATSPPAPTPRRSPPPACRRIAGTTCRRRSHAAFEREASVQTPEECREVWRDQLPFFANDPAAVEPMLDRVVFQPEAHHPHELRRAARARRAGRVRRPRAGDRRRATTARSRRATRAGSRRRPGGELLIIDGAGHFPFAETPDRYWPPLIDWLNRTAS